MLWLMQAERSEVSEHLLRVWLWLRAANGWATAAEIAVGANVAPRTARAHAMKLVQLGVCDQAEVFPAHRYRVSALAAKRNKAFTLRLAEAERVFGMEPR